jgi:hypothetical protein
VQNFIGQLVCRNLEIGQVFWIFRPFSRLLNGYSLILPINLLVDLLKHILYNEISFSVSTKYFNHHPGTAELLGKLTHWLRLRSLRIC